MLSVKTKTSASLENQNTEQEVAVQAPGTALWVSQEAVGADFQKGGGYCRLGLRPGLCR